MPFLDRSKRKKMDEGPSLSQVILDNNPEQMVLHALRQHLAKSGSTWVEAKYPLEFVGVKGVNLAESEGKIYVSDHTGLAEYHLSNWIRARQGRYTIRIDLDDHGLLDNQRHAGTVCLSSPIAILSGLPGSGKTHTAKAIVEALQRSGIKTTGCAFTGRAAKRLSEMTGLESLTLHRLLGHDGTGFTVSEIDAECILVDEVQLLTPTYLLSLASRMRHDARLIMIGDPNQLTMTGRSLADMIDSGLIPHCHLNQVVRQEADSPIGHAAAKILAGEIPEEEKSPSGVGGIFMRQCESFELDGHKRPQNHPMTIAEAMAHVDGSDLMAVRTICHRNVTKDLLNDQFNNYRRNRAEKVPVMQTKNRHTESLYNGDIGWLDVRCINVGDGFTHILRGGEWDYAWTTTTHKVIGTEARSVQVALEESMTRQILYTAVTRGKTRVAITGPLQTLIKICRRNEPRKTTLLDRFLLRTARIIDNE